MLKLPPELILSLLDVKGFDKDAFEKVHASGEQNTSIRINPAKVHGNAQLFIDGIEPGCEVISRVPWSTNGYYLSSRPSFTTDPGFHAGAYYVQEASSMFLEEVLEQTAATDESLRVLDLCAAPGGKSTLVLSAIGENSLLVSNEVIKTRVTVLAENIAKWGAPNVIVTNNDPRDFQRLQEFFDVIIVDAPCSGSGLFRKDPNAISEWSEQNVLHCSQRQQRILADVLPALKAGGLLIYSTCSYSVEEDEAISDWLTGSNEMKNVRCNLKPEWNIIETTAPKSNAYGYRFFPDQLKGEGFYMAIFKKGAPVDMEQAGPKGKMKSERLTAKEIAVAGAWINEPANFFFIRQQDEVLAVPVQLEQELARVQAALYIKKAGVKVGTIIRNELIPAHELALSTILHSGTIKIEVDKDTALQYLRKQAITLHSGHTGWALITYRQLPLGWVKILQNRVNNYYPKEWRILHK